MRIQNYHTLKIFFRPRRGCKRKLLGETALILAEESACLCRPASFEIEVHKLQRGILVKGVGRDEHLKRALKIILILRIITGGNACFQLFCHACLELRFGDEKPVAEISAFGNIKPLEQFVGKTLRQRRIYVAYSVYDIQVAGETGRRYIAAVGNYRIFGKILFQQIQRVSKIIVGRIFVLRTPKDGSQLFTAGAPLYGKVIDYSLGFFEGETKRFSIDLY